MFSGGGGNSRGRTSGGAGVSGGGSYRPHNCMSPGCTRKGDPERFTSYDVTRPHNCMSPGCTRKGETEVVRVDRAVERQIVNSIKEEVKKGRRKAAPTLAPDPNPFEFTIKKSHCEGGLTLALIEYHGCTNYEGNKILLFRQDVVALASLTMLDPHFLETDENGLLARFVPTDEGWKMGMALLQAILYK
jgi:hypothetical protein